MLAGIKKDSIVELDLGLPILYESGLLFAINREILHPFGLAIGVKTDNDGKISGGIFIDCSSDPGALIFDPTALIDGAFKYNKFLEEIGRVKKQLRGEKLGYVVQPIQFEFPFIDNIQVEGKSVQMKKEEVEVVPKDNFVSNVEKGVEKIFEKEEKNKPSGRGAGVRKDLISKTPSFSSKIKSLAGEDVDIDNLSETPSITPKIDVSKLHVLNKTKNTAECSHPNENLVSEFTQGGGKILFCSLCGTQFRDSDLNDNL